MQKAVRIRVYGLVQGVFFRDSTRRKAQELGLGGFVKNEPDGSVLIEAEGESSAVDQLVEWSRRGPPAARVERVEVEGVGLREFKLFEIQS